MSVRMIVAGLALAAMPAFAFAQEAPSVEMGDRIAGIGGCHDCHTAGFAEADGQITDPATALTGHPVGYRGPWGTTYASNLRLIAQDKGSEDAWFEYMRDLRARPPMPWFNIHRMTEAEIRSLYQYIVSLGEPGEPAPDYVPPGEEPTTPYLVFAPPTMPGQ